MTRFNVVNEQNKRRAKREPKVKGNDACATVTALRVMRPLQAVRVEMRNEQPARVHLHGMRGEVVAASGPWRSSGDWWQEDSWHQNEWDLEIEFAMPSLVVAQLYPERSRGNAAPVPHRKTQERLQPIKQKSASPQRGLYRVYFDILRQEWFLRGEYD